MPRQRPPDGWQALAEDAEAIRVARRIAGRFARTCPKLADEFEAEAYVAVCDAAIACRRRPDAQALFTWIIVQKMRSVIRDWRPWGYRERNAPDAPLTYSFGPDDERTHRGFWVTDEEPESGIGDYLETISEELPAAHRAVFLAHHRDCSSPETIAAERGCQVDSILRILRAAYSGIRQRFPEGIAELV